MTTSPPVRRVAPNVALAGTFVLFGLVIASFFPFFALFLSERGLSPSQIGVVVAVMAIARIGANPVWGSLADARLGRRKVVRLGLTGAIGGALLLSAVGRGFAQIWAPAALFACFSGQLGPNIDAFALAHLGDGAASGYGRIRAWESLSYACACITFGLFLQGVGSTWLMVVNAGAMLAVLGWTTALAPDRPQRRARRSRLGTVGEVFRASPRFWGYLAGALVLWTGFNGAWNFLALRIESRGGGPLLIGIGTALGGLVEVGVMLGSARLTRRIGLRTVYLFGSSVYATAFLLWGLVKSPVVVSLLTVFEGFGFALLFTSSVVIVGKLVPKELYSTGQSLSSTVGFGVGPILGGAVGGWVFQHKGAETLYLGAAVLALCGGAIVWATLSGPEFRRPGVDGLREGTWPAPEGPATFPPGELGVP
jgi:MFS transporter, PPP family, 3-phenylpropionic acid transporter